MTKPHLPFIDWMKSLGLLLIVFGHVSATMDHLVPPIYPKQLGVAFFLFVSGYSLARETKPAGEVVFNRLFEIYLYGVAIALLVSAETSVRLGTIAASNYLPFLLGANVVFNNFPANPTTWFIGTYLHVLLIWAFLLRGVRIRPWMLALSVVAEVAARAALAAAGGLYVAYMAVPNWMTVFLLGLHHGQRPEETPATGPARHPAGLVLLALAWPALAGPWIAEYSFPFMRPAAGPPLASLAVMSAATTLVYFLYTETVYQVTRRLRASAAARFVARNTPIVFIAHMPVFYALRGPLGRWTSHSGLRVAIQFVACFLVLVALSQLLGTVIRPRTLRDRLWRAGFGRGPRRPPHPAPASGGPPELAPAEGPEDRA
jgi:hypothetical protein